MTVSLDSLDLAALLCSRVCHDLISPIGAIVNGLEVMEDDHDPETREFAMALIKKSVNTASAKLQFCRLAFGAAGSAGAQIDLGDAEKMSRGLFEDEKTRLIWNLPRILLEKNRVKLLLNILLIAGQVIPRGGEMNVDPVGTGEAPGFKVTVRGPHARLPQTAVPLLAGEAGEEGINAHAIQPYYTGLLARHCGLSVAITMDGEAVVLTTT